MRDAGPGPGRHRRGARTALRRDRHRLADRRARGAGGEWPSRRELPERGPHDDALIVYTSGTTGSPKGAVHTHGSLLAGVEALRTAWAWGPEDRLILSLPLFHVHGLCAGLFGSLAAGASVTVFDRFDEEAILAAAPSNTMFFGVPTMYHRLAVAPDVGALGSLRLCVSGSAPLAADLWRELAAAGVPVLGALRHDRDAAHAVQPAARRAASGLGRRPACPVSTLRSTTPTSTAWGSYSFAARCCAAGYWGPGPGPFARRLVRDRRPRLGGGGRVRQHPGPAHRPHHHRRSQRLPRARSRQSWPATPASRTWQSSDCRRRSGARPWWPSWSAIRAWTRSRFATLPRRSWHPSNARERSGSSTHCRAMHWGRSCARSSADWRTPRQDRRPRSAADA